MDEPVNLRERMGSDKSAKDANQTKQKRETYSGILQRKRHRTKMMQRKTISME